MKKIIDYQIVYGYERIPGDFPSTGGMEERIKEFIKEGWEPVGGLTVVFSPTRPKYDESPHIMSKHFFQTLVKYED